VLSAPEQSLVERRFLRIADSDRSLLDPEEVLTTARRYDVEHELSGDEWTEWSKNVRVVWKMIPEEEV